MGKIMTSYVFPPIPIRHNDWVAYYDGDEEEGLRGWGKTEKEAIEDLKSQCEHDCKHICSGCGKSFHEIKDEFDCKHDDELTESLQLNCGDYYCHYDCLRDSR